MHRICICKRTREKKNCMYEAIRVSSCRAQTYLLLYVGVETASIVMGSSKRKKKKKRNKQACGWNLKRWLIGI